MRNNQYTTLSEATADLLKKGYSGNFTINTSGKLVDGKGGEFEASLVKINEFHRFEGMSNPADSSILYAVEINNGMKGIVVDSFGADGSEITAEFISNAEQT